MSTCFNLIKNLNKLSYQILIHQSMGYDNLHYLRSKINIGSVKSTYMRRMWTLKFFFIRSKLW